MKLRKLKKRIKRNMQIGRTTVIVGAGACLDFDLPDGVKRPSTEEITQRVLGMNVADPSTGAPITLLQDIYTRLKSEYPGYVHFELLFHVLESIIAYNNHWAYKAKDPKYVPVFAPFVTSIQNYGSNYYGLIRDFLLEIMDVVDSYDKPFRTDKNNNLWYREFWNKYKSRWDVFNFNYDTTIEESLGDVEDGFCQINPQTNFMHFVPTKLRENKNNLSTMSHMHGCIRFFDERYDKATYDKEVFMYDFHDLYKYPSYDDVRKLMIGSLKSTKSNQAGEQLYNTPIITGLRKPDKLSCAPFVFYHGHLYEKVNTNRSLLITGYSFGDLYVNEHIMRMHLIHGSKKRVVLIDWWGIDRKYTQEELEDGDISSLVHERMVWHSADPSFNNELAMFLCRMTGCVTTRDAIDSLTSYSFDSPMVSSNKCLMLFIGGFRAATNHREEIYSFLNS